MIKCSQSRVSVLQENILYIDVSNSERFGAEDYKEANEVSTLLGTNKPFYSLINLGDHATLDEETCKVSIEYVTSGKVKAEALVVYSLNQRINLKRALRQKSKMIPIRFFKNPELAMIWLESMANKL